VTIREFQEIKVDQVDGLLILMFLEVDEIQVLLMEVQEIGMVGVTMVFGMVLLVLTKLVLFITQNGLLDYLFSFWLFLFLLSLLFVLLHCVVGGVRVCVGKRGNRKVLTLVQMMIWNLVSREEMEEEVLVFVLVRRFNEVLNLRVVNMFQLGSEECHHRQVEIKQVLCHHDVHLMTCRNGVKENILLFGSEELLRMQVKDLQVRRKGNVVVVSLRIIHQVGKILKQFLFG
jgi:hypothetical protein